MRITTIFFPFFIGFILLSFVELYSQSITAGPSKGRLLIIGGGAKAPIFMDLFKHYAGGENASIVVFPTSMSDGWLDRNMEKVEQNFKKKGFKKVKILHTRDTMIANSAEFVKAIEEASGAWFVGGRQWRHADAYLNTKTQMALFDLLDRGGIIAGSSAGATIQGSYLARGDTKTNTIMIGDHEEGLGFVKNIVIDQHLFARNRQFDMFEILAVYPDLLGVGLDENTGMLVEGNHFQVFGTSYVAIYDGTRWSRERDTTIVLEKGAKEFYVLRRGDEYDMINRKVSKIQDFGEAPISRKILKPYTGRFKSSEGIILKIKANHQFLRIEKEKNFDFILLVKQGKDTFRSKRFNNKLQFMRNKKGEIESVIWSNQYKTEILFKE